MNEKEIFGTIFGIPQEAVKETCVITPFFSREMVKTLQINETSKGLIYLSGSSRSFTLISGKMGSGFIGDAVLHLKNTKCRNIIFFGSCGAVKETKQTRIGNIVLVKKALCQDSFTGMLLKKKTAGAFFPDKQLSEMILPYTDGTKNCLSVASLKLEEFYLGSSGMKDIDVVDMETSAVFAAAQKTKRKSAAVLFITDILKTKPFYRVSSGFKNLLNNSCGVLSATLNKIAQ